MKVKQVFLIDFGQIYSIVFVTLESMYNQHLPIFEAGLETFEPEGPGPIPIGFGETLPGSS